MVLQEDEGSSPVSQRTVGATFHYWGRNFATIAKSLPYTSFSPAKYKQIIIILIIKNIRLKILKRILINN